MIGSASIGFPGEAVDATVVAINVSDGGVPKRPVPDAYVGVDGMAGDRQANLVYHGGPDRAVCLYSLERIQALQAEGHPITAGATGENLTVSGLDWDHVVPGAKLRVGAIVVLEITSYTKPCRKIQTTLSDHKFSRLSQKHFPGWSRVYAKVEKPGRIRVGDRIELIARDHA